MGLFQNLKQQLHTDDPQQRKRELRWLMGKLRRQRGALICVSALSLVGIVTGLAGNVASKHLIDCITAGELTQLLTWGGVFAAMILVSLLFGSLSSHRVAKLRIRAKNDLQKACYRRILAARWESLEPYRSGELLYLLNEDVSTVSDATVGFLPGLLSSGFRFVATAAVMLYFEPTMALIALAGLPVLLLLSRRLTKKMRSHDLSIKQMGGDVMAFQTESLRNLTSIKAFALTDRFTGRLDGLQQDYERTFLDANSFHVGMNAVMSLAGMVISGLGIGYGVYRLWRGQLSFGSVTMLISLAASLRSAASALLSQIKYAVSITNSAGRLMALEELPGEELRIPEEISREKIRVELSQVAFSYEDGDTLLHPFDFYADAGDVIAITGPSGEGKTTLLRLLLGLVVPQQGSACITDEMGHRCPLNAGTRPWFSYVPQGNSVLSGTVAENLRILSPDATEEALWAALEAACAADFVRRLPMGLQQRIGNGGHGLSEGQAQRLAIARALLRKAPVLLLDEATSALDNRTEKELLENLSKGEWMRTCILVTHRPASAALCRRSYEISQGYVTEVRHGE